MKNLYSCVLPTNGLMNHNNISQENCNSMGMLFPVWGTLIQRLTQLIQMIRENIDHNFDMYHIQNQQQVGAARSIARQEYSQKMEYGQQSKSTIRRLINKRQVRLEQWIPLTIYNAHHGGRSKQADQRAHDDHRATLDNNLRNSDKSCQHAVRPLRSAQVPLVYVLHETELTMNVHCVVQHHGVLDDSLRGQAD